MTLSRLIRLLTICLSISVTLSNCVNEKFINPPPWHESDTWRLEVNTTAGWSTAFAALENSRGQIVVVCQDRSLDGSGGNSIILRTLTSDGRLMRAARVGTMTGYKPSKAVLASDESIWIVSRTTEGENSTEKVTRARPTGEVLGDYSITDNLQATTAILAADDMGCYVCGYKFLPDEHVYEFFVRKLTATADVQWTVSRQRSYYPRLIDMCSTGSGLALMVYKTGGGTQRADVFFVSSSGTAVDSITVGDAYAGDAYAIRPMGDSLYACFFRAFDAGVVNVVTRDGTVVAAYRVPRAGGLTRVAVAPDRGFVFAESASDNGPHWFALTKGTHDGFLAWYRVYGGAQPAFDELVSLTPMQGGGYILCGSSDPHGSAPTRALILRVDHDGFIGNDSVQVIQ